MLKQSMPLLVPDALISTQLSFLLLLPLFASKPSKLQKVDNSIELLSNKIDTF